MLFLSVASIIIIVIDNHGFHVGDWWTVFDVQHVKIGDIYDNSKVVRVDRGLGLLLEVPSIPEPTPAFVSVCSVWTSFNDAELIQYEIWMFNCILSVTPPGKMKMIIEIIVDRYLILLKRRSKILRRSTRKEIVFEFGFLGYDIWKELLQEFWRLSLYFYLI